MFILLKMKCLKTEISLYFKYIDYVGLIPIKLAKQLSEILGKFTITFYSKIPQTRKLFFGKIARVGGAHERNFSEK